MYVLLINPEDHTITEKQIEPGLLNIYKILGCSMIEAPVIFPPNGDVLYCDEEAWLNVGDDDKLAGFSFPDWSYAILGKALVVGDNGEGEDADCTMKITDFDNIIWKANHSMRVQGENMGMI